VLTFLVTTFVESTWSKLTDSLYWEEDAKDCRDSSPDEFHLGEFSREKAPSTVV